MASATETYSAFHSASLSDPEDFWLAEAQKIQWFKAPSRALDGQPPFSRWFTDGETNLCLNAVDRWAASQPDTNALLFVSGETGEEQSFTYADLYREVNGWAALLRGLDVSVGDRVLIYMPMIPEAVFAMLACARIGAIHAVVFGGFASGALAARIDDAQPKIIVSTDAGRRMGQVIAYRPLLEGALEISTHRPDHIVTVDRGLVPFEREPRDVDARAALEVHAGEKIDPVPLPASHPSYILYTSGTTGRPKGVQRDTGGYAVALRSSMDHIYCGGPGDTMLTASDIGWVVGHSYIVYGPLLAGMTTIMFEGAPTHPDPGVMWRIVDRHRVRLMFTSPTALRVLRKSGEAPLSGVDLSSLKTIFVAGEPLDAPTVNWWRSTTGAAVIDNYWQTETGWPVLALCRGVAELQPKEGSPGLPVYGYDVQLVHEDTGEVVGPDEKGLLTIAPPLPPGTLTTLWRNDGQYEKTYFIELGGRQLYSTFDWAIRDGDGYITLLGRSDDIINVAGHRLGTREIEEVLNAQKGVSESAVVGVSDPIKGEVPVAFVVLKPECAASDDLKIRLNQAVRARIGAIASVHELHVISALPKTRSGKIVRRLLKAICENTEPGELTTLEDPMIVDDLIRTVRRGRQSIA
ncbi:Propionate--CoA ligase [Sphingobium chlorophenolicum L-1]|uniref:Propionate--CoA ligase n=1 Tax=Sphingobium chlorophenolicum L-1 TaxID=690566 RepID=F6F389_SPHCR|nr:propionate--CoA ligase [Sphingobium chlorophenolicum]AEG50901.1 Propionate--CoA ligase [Sphingobium chlorophenolicum L-1]